MSTDYLIMQVHNIINQYDPLSKMDYLEESTQFIHELDRVLSTPDTPYDILHVTPELYYAVCSVCLCRSYSVVEQLQVQDSDVHSSIAKLLSTLVLPQYITYLRQYGAVPSGKPVIKANKKTIIDVTLEDPIPLNFYSVFGTSISNIPAIPILTPISHRPPPIYDSLNK
jgi:hypothetical protein